MFRVRALQRHLSLGMAIAFAVQLLAIVFCFSNRADAAPISMSSQMASSCPMGVDAPAHSTQDKTPCAHCDIPDSGWLASGIGTLSFDLPLLAIVTGFWLMQDVKPAIRGPRVTQAQAPPHSAALLYQTSLRIRL